MGERYTELKYRICNPAVYVVVVYTVTIVAIGHGLLKKFWPFDTRLRSTHCREFNYLSIFVIKGEDNVKTTQAEEAHLPQPVYRGLQDRRHVIQLDVQ